MKSVMVSKSVTDFNSYRSARVKSLFNAESGANFAIQAELPVDETDWRLGVIVGPSGSGKTSLGREFWGDNAFYEARGWSDNQPIIDDIAPDGDFNAVTGALASVGLGTVPSWLRPYGVLSNGEKFRADLARIISEAPARVVIDEFTSVVDRQIARMGALAFAKAWKRTGGQAVLLSCHYDILDWLEPDWVFDTATGGFARGGRRRPKFNLEIRETDGSYWQLFEPHHYLKLPRPVAASYYVGFVDGEAVVHLAGAPRSHTDARFTRLVVMPEWQGAGVGLRFLDYIAEMWLIGENRYGKRLSGIMHTSHPGLCGALRARRGWVQISSVMHGADKKKSRDSIIGSMGDRAVKTGYGGHLRAVQGFRYVGVEAWERLTRKGGK